jgi:two-component system, NtrC family, nitrogen regulation response regulator GlnG
MNDDSSTLTIGPLDTLTGARRGLPLLPALTIAWHPDASRIGTIAPLSALLQGDSAVLMREEPAFFTPGSNVGRAIDHRGMSRDPVLSVAAAPGVLELRRSPDTRAEIEVDGQPFTGVRPITAVDLRVGLVLTVARQFVFILHGVRYPISRSPNLGLLGVGDSIEEVRRLVAKAADLSTSVLLRGESGTGKELVARAVHETSARRAKPFVPINMATILSSSATSELFGHEKGSFTGATESRPGHFVAANGGTLFLDEIGDMVSDAQPMLLRVLDDRRVQPLGSSHTRPVDVRLIAATDARLEAAVNAGRFHPALYHRLNSAFQIALPALRERREDIGLLFITFLRRALSANECLHLLDEPRDGVKPWLPTRIAAAICLAPWPGNVRALEGLAGELAARAAADSNFKPADYVPGRLKQQLALIAPSAPAAAAVPVPARGRSGEITNDQVLDAFDRVGWNVTRAAALLGVDKSTLSRRLAKESAIRTLMKLTLAELQRQKVACGDDVNALADTLGVPAALLARRLRSGED